MSSEFDAVPVSVIVHDPVRARSFAAMRSVADAVELERRYLFREFPDEELYRAQHEQLVAVLRRHVARVYYLDELVTDHESRDLTRANPNHVFTRDSLITIPWIPGGYIGARMRPPLRRSERRVMERAVQRLGLQPIVEMPEEMFLEGGDVVPFSIDGRRTLLVGFGPRTSREALTFLHDALVPEFADDIVGVELASWRMNLDGGLLPVADDVVISDRRSIVSAVVLDGSGSRECDLFAVFADLGIHVIDTTREESVYSQSCNCICLGERTIICYDLCPRVREQLEGRGIDVLTIPGSELVKGRGGPRCMTRPIYLDLRRTEQREKEDHARLEWLRSAVRNGVDDLDQGNYTTLRSRREIEVFIDQIQAETRGTGC